MLSEQPDGVRAASWNWQRSGVCIAAAALFAIALMLYFAASIGTERDLCPQDAEALAALRSKVKSVESASGSFGHRVSVQIYWDQARGDYCIHSLTVKSPPFAGLNSLLVRFTELRVVYLPDAMQAERDRLQTELPSVFVASPRPSGGWFWGRRSGC